VVWKQTPCSRQEGWGLKYFYIWEAVENKTAWPEASYTKSVGIGREQESCYIILASLHCIINLLDRKWGLGGEGEAQRRRYNKARVGLGILLPS
jgi:hypothetical protein